MKILGLCFFLFVFFLAAISQAQESSAAKNTQTIVENSPAAADGIVLDLNSKSSPPGSDNSCAYMRTYRVKRDRPASDMTRPAGYTTCVSFKRFEVRSAVQVQDEPAVRK